MSIASMPTQKISIAAYETLCAEIADALAGSDFKAALSKWAQAQAVLNGLLNSSISTGNDSVTRVQSLRDLGDAIRLAMQAGANQDHSRFMKTSVGYHS